MLLRAPGQPGRGPAHTGRLIVDETRGVIRVRKWPRHKKRRRTLAELRREEWFWLVQKLYHWADSSQQVFFTEKTAGTPWYPRDLFAKFITGRAFRLAMDTGQVLYPMGVRTDISALLDAIIQDRGGLITRGEFWWDGLAPGASGAVLTSQGAGAAPTWAPSVVTPSVAFLTKAGTQTPPTSTWTRVTGWTVARDDPGIWDAGGSRFLVPAGVSLVTVSFAMYETGGGALGTHAMAIRHNGQFMAQAHGNQAGNWQGNVTLLARNVAPGDTIDAAVFFTAARTVGAAPPTVFSLQVLG